MTPHDQLALEPLRNAKARLVSDAPAEVVLELDAVYAWWLGPLPRLLGAKKSKRLSLDGVALTVWRRIDDRVNLGQLIDGIAAEHQLEFNEARLLLLQFLRSLSQRGLVVLGDRTDLGPTSPISSPD